MEGELCLCLCFVMLFLHGYRDFFQCSGIVIDKQALRSQALQFGSGLSIGGFIELLQHLRVAIGAGTCFSSKSTTRTWSLGK